MKRLLLLLTFFACVSTLRAQGTGFCQFNFNFSQDTGFVSQPQPIGFDNREKGCNFLTLDYQATGLSAVTVQLNSANGALAQGTFAIYSGTVSAGINPNTSTTQAESRFSGYVGWLQVAVTGTPTVAGGNWSITGTVYGSQSGFQQSASSACPASGAASCFVQGAGAAGAAVAGNPVLICGTDGTNCRTISTDATGEQIPSNASFNQSSGLGVTNLGPTGAAGARLVHSIVSYVYDGSGLNSQRGNNTGITLSNASVAMSDGQVNNPPGPSDVGGNNFFYRVMPLVFNGTTWDRAPGNAAGGRIMQGAAAQGATVVGNPVLIAGRSSGAAGTGAVGTPGVCDSLAVLNASAGASTVVVAGVAGKRTRICSISWSNSSAAAASVQWKSGTGTTCGTGTNNLSGVMVTTLQGVPYSIGNGLGFVMQTVNNADDLCVTTVASTYTGWISYAQF